MRQISNHHHGGCRGRLFWPVARTRTRTADPKPNTHDNSNPLTNTHVLSGPFVGAFGAHALSIRFTVVDSIEQPIPSTVVVALDGPVVCSLTVRVRPGIVPG